MGLINMIIDIFSTFDPTTNSYFNFIGIIPYSFGNSSQVLFTFSLGIPLWFALIISSINLSLTTFLAKLLPTGTPLILRPIIVIIELIRILFRPLTLCFRLAANITAGHVVISLIGTLLKVFLLLVTPTTYILIASQIGYIIFEIGICTI